MTPEEIQVLIDALKFTYLSDDEATKVKAVLTELNTGGGGSGGGSWGEILGNIEDQTDLITILDSLQAQINAKRQVANKLFNYYNF